MFFSKRACNALSSSSRCSGDKSFLLLLMFRALVALIVVASHVSYLVLRSATWFFRLVFAFLSILHHLKLKLHHLPPHHIAKVVLPKSSVPWKMVHQKFKTQPAPESQQLYAHR